MFRALVLNKEDGKVSAALRELDAASLPEEDVVVSVEYSNLNYKDGLVLNGLGNLTKVFPHVPGIDFSGTVLESKNAEFKPGDKVVLTGWRVGEIYWGGYAQKASVKASQLQHLPAGLSTRDAMIVGTAGLTAMLSIMALEASGLRKENGPVLVTGATGGVGSVATAILANLGYSVTASSGKPEKNRYLESLGADNVIARGTFTEAGGKPLESETWAGCIDTVGGTTLARVLSQMKYNAAVAAVGLVGGAKLETTVIPFLLRGVKLLGIDSVLCDNETRRKAWARIAKDLPFEKLSAGVTTCSLDEVSDYGRKILAGEISGRVVIDVNA